MKLAHKGQRYRKHRVSRFKREQAARKSIFTYTDEEWQRVVVHSGCFVDFAIESGVFKTSA